MMFSSGGGAFGGASVFGGGGGGMPFLDHHEPSEDDWLPPPVAPRWTSTAGGRVLNLYVTDDNRGAVECITLAPQGSIVARAPIPEFAHTPSARLACTRLVENVLAKQRDVETGPEGLAIGVDPSLYEQGVVYTTTSAGLPRRVREYTADERSLIIGEWSGADILGVSALQAGEWVLLFALVNINVSMPAEGDSVEYTTCHVTFAHHPEHPLAVVRVGGHVIPIQAGSVLASPNHLVTRPGASPVSIPSRVRQPPTSSQPAASTGGPAPARTGPGIGNSWVTTPLGRFLDWLDAVGDRPSSYSGWEVGLIEGGHGITKSKGGPYPFHCPLPGGMDAVIVSSNMCLLYTPVSPIPTLMPITAAVFAPLFEIPRECHDNDCGIGVSLLLRLIGDRLFASGGGTESGISEFLVDIDDGGVVVKRVPLLPHLKPAVILGASTCPPLLPPPRGLFLLIDCTTVGRNPKRKAFLLDVGRGGPGAPVWAADVSEEMKPAIDSGASYGAAVSSPSGLVVTTCPPPPEVPSEELQSLITPPFPSRCVAATPPGVDPVVLTVSHDFADAERKMFVHQDDMVSREELTDAQWHPFCSKAPADLVEAAFTVGSPGSSFAFPASRANSVYRRKPGTNGWRYWVVAGYGAVPNALRSPNYEELQSPGGLADYLGAPLMFATDDDPGCVKEAQFGDMDQGRRSSNTIACLVIGRSASRQGVSIGDHVGFRGGAIVWMGVVDVRTDGSTHTGNIGIAPDGMTLATIGDALSAAREGRSAETFMVDSGCLLVIDPEDDDASNGVTVPQAKRGIWNCRTTDDCHQLLAWHSDSDAELADLMECRVYGEDYESLTSRVAAETNGDLTPWVKEKQLPDGFVFMSRRVSVNGFACGIFDKEHYADTPSRPADAPPVYFPADYGDRWDAPCDSVRWSKQALRGLRRSGGAETLPHGCSSLSGYGDGEYYVQGRVVHGDDPRDHPSSEVVAVRIVFAWPPPEEEESGW